MQTVDWQEVYERYAGLWIALDEEETRVVSAFKDAQAAYDDAVAKGIGVPILLRVPDAVVPYIGSF